VLAHAVVLLLRKPAVLVEMMFYSTFAVAGWQRTASCENWHTEKAADTHQWYYTSTSRWLTGHLAQNWHNMTSTGLFCAENKRQM